MKKLLIASLILGASTLVMAKLPAPTPEAKAKSDEAAAKSAWSGKIDAYKLCLAQDKTAAAYYKSAQAAAKETRPATVMPPCADPGAFSYAPAEAAKPLEAAGAHSPAATATSPPSSNVPDAVTNPVKKP